MMIGFRKFKILYTLIISITIIFVSFFNNPLTPFFKGDLVETMPFWET